LFHADFPLQKRTFVGPAMEYNFTTIEAKWKAIWENDQLYKVSEDTDKPKCYVLDMFPYPSGAGLHVGHPLGYIASDIYSRYKRLRGYNVLHPMGFDSFGLPAEQYALETGQHPADTTVINIERYKSQLNNIGFCYDWHREVRTSDANYYKWTQWIFAQLFNAWYNSASNKAEPIETLLDLFEENASLLSQHTDKAWSELDHLQQQNILMKHRLAYRAESYVNWCEALGTVLANDEVINGFSERGGHPVQRKLMSQWFLRITAFADRLLDGLNCVDFPESLKEMQRNWIGKSVGAEVSFDVAWVDEKIKVFTTRPDTIYGVSFLVLSPEHPLISKIIAPSAQESIAAYQQYVKSKSDRERQAEKTITGCNTGAVAVHPLTKQELPVWISEYVLMGYGTGAIMAVPCGDDRDHSFALHFDLPIPNIFDGVDVDIQAYTDKSAPLCSSGSLNGLSSTEASSAAIAMIQELNLGKAKINYRMRDAGFSRQRYWGEPFPITYNDMGICELVSEFPVALPHVGTYSPGPEGKGPLANIADWVNTASGARETDTMPGYAGSSWYYLRYMDPHNTQEVVSKQKAAYWNQVDVYVGGAEHAVGHLLYSRMWCKALMDLGHISFDEPYKKIINQGMIGGASRLVYRIKDSNTYVSYGLVAQYDTTPIHVDVTMVDDLQLDIQKFKAWRLEYANAEFILEDGKYICGQQFEKMSKRYHNVVNPDDVIAKYGADTFRMYEMFLGPIELSKPWDTQGIEGTHRFLKKLWRLFFNELGAPIVSDEKATQQELKVLHKHIKKIQNDIENFAVNTSVSQFMITINELAILKCGKRAILQPLLITLAPFAPFISEELFQILGNKESIFSASFPEYNDQLLAETSFTYPVAIQGKTRTELSFDLDASAEDIKLAVLENPIVVKWVDDKEIKKFIFVKGKMINVVV
jgi:leucyl-tRNA synthetase